MQKTNVICYYFFVKGLFGRNRKVKTEMFYVKKHSLTPLTPEEARELMNEVLKTEVKPKGEYQVKLVEHNGTLENDSGVQIYSTNLFGAKTLFLENRKA